MDKKQEIEVAIKAAINGEIKHLAVDNEDSIVTLTVEVPEGSNEKTLKREIAKIIKLDLGFKGLKLSIEQKSTEQTTPNSKTKYITITSGKGGVGKSTVSGNLAVALARLGNKVGLIDADIYGPSLPHLFNMKESVVQISADKKILPMITTDGVAMMSTEFLTEDSMPLMWRGPMLSRMIKHFFEDVYWEDDYDYIIVDLPPGTGDIPMDLKNFIPEAKAIVVTTPNKMASHVAIKSGLMAGHLGHDILGVIENMSYYKNPVTGDKEKIFGAGGGTLVAENLATTLLAEIPIAQAKENFEGGIFTSDEENGIIYLALAEKIMTSLL